MKVPVRRLSTTGRRQWRIASMVCVWAAALYGGAVGARAAEINWEQGVGLGTTAQLTASIAPEGVDTSCHVQYETEYAFGHEGWASATTVPCAPEDLGAGGGSLRARAELVGLSLDTSYEFRFVATTGGVAIMGAAETFATFGIQEFVVSSLDNELHAYSQAGGHPSELKANINLNSSRLHQFTPGGQLSVVGQEVKDVRVVLPPGFVGNPAATPQCPQRLEESEKCPGNTQIGTISVLLSDEVLTREASPKPVFNLVPPKGVAARFGALVNLQASAFIDAKLRSGSDYRIEADSLNITSFAQPMRVTVTMWGDPAASSHDSERFCVGSHGYYEKGCPYEGEGRPFLTEPTACVGPLDVNVEMDSYQEPDESVGASAQLPAAMGCENVPFAPTVEVQPTTRAVDTPSGVKVDLTVPQHEEEAHPASSDLKDASIVLPVGMDVNPSSAEGLGTCSEAETGFVGFKELDPSVEPGVRTSQFTPGPAECPDGAKLGTVVIRTPLIDHPLEGAMYLATPRDNPFGSLMAVYLAVYDPITGVVVKLPGLVQSDARTGQVTTVFEQNPQLPFEHLEVSLFEGERAALTTPLTCGSHVTSSSLVPWSGNPAATPSAAFQTTEEPGGGTCPGSEAQALNAPGFEAGTTGTRAATSSSFVLKLKREDGSQRFRALDVTLPPGLIGNVTDVQECPQVDIEAAEALGGEGQGAVELAHPSCPAGSEVGVVHVGAGSGTPLYVTGHAYFAGPYEGDPFSMVIITPAIAGPFDLGTVVVRAGLYIDPHTAQVTVKSDLPTIRDGIPLDIRRLGVEITRPGFLLNPTNCEAMAVSGQETSTAGQTVPLSDRFQIGGCRELPFKPSFKALTHAKHSRKNGAYLHVVAMSGPGQANIKSVEVKLPKDLPARESTLKQACAEAQFDENPAGCPVGSQVGTATAYTPLLPVPVTGPAIFVSHGGAAYPDLDLVLQGDGVTVILAGNTHINGKTDVTSSSFTTVPDVPMSRFDLVLPAQRNSALGASGNLCTKTIQKKKRAKVRRHGKWVRTTKTIRHTVRRHLKIFTIITGQNGAVIKKNTDLWVTGCKTA